MHDLEAIADQLRASGEYRVQRRLQPRSRIHNPHGAPTRSGLFVDVETTGIDPKKNEIIELAMIPFSYLPEGLICDIGPPLEQFNEPSLLIPPIITQLTGITDKMVAGHRIDLNAVNTLVDRADLVIAHNANFDRRFLERLTATFVLKSWACSMTQVDWIKEGHEGLKLAYLAAGAGFFYNRHRAEHDCRAGIELLAAPLPTSGIPAMCQLLENARRPSWRIWAQKSPFDLKDVLKARGYCWNGDDNTNPKSWYIDVDVDQREAEIAFLRQEIYARDVDLMVQKITAFNRFSDRA